MTQKQWDQFLYLLQEIVNDPRPWSEKAFEVADRATDYGVATELQEFANWFQSDE